MAPPVVDALLESQRDQRRSRLAALSDRERDVLREMARGLSNPAIAGTLHVSESAVSKHVAAIFAKLVLHEDRQVDRRVRAVLDWVTGTERPR